MKFNIASSLVAAPLAHPKQVVAELENAGVDFLHFDIEDGVFVPVMNLGIKIIRDLRPLTTLPFDVHLMTVDPEWLSKEVTQAGADRVSVHYEACMYPRRVLRQIVDLGAVAGIAINPATSLPDLSFLRPYLSFVVILTTEPEITDSPFLEEILAKVQQGKAQPGMQTIEWVVDGGINAENIQRVLHAGADTVVVGRYVFSQGDIHQRVQHLRKAAL